MRISICSTAIVAVLLFVGFATPPAHGQVGGTSVAVVDVPYIFKNHAGFKSEIDAIKTDIDSYKEWISGEEKRLQGEVQKLQQFNPGSQQYKQLEESIARMRMETQLKGAQKQKEFMEREAEVYYRAYQTVEQAVAQFAARNRIGLVLRYSSEAADPTKRESIMATINRMVVYQDRLNITDQILQAINGRPASPTPPTTPGGTATRPVAPAGRSLR